MIHSVYRRQVSAQKSTEVLLHPASSTHATKVSPHNKLNLGKARKKVVAEAVPDMWLLGFWYPVIYLPYFLEIRTQGHFSSKIIHKQLSSSVTRKFNWIWNSLKIGSKLLPTFSGSLPGFSCLRKMMVLFTPLLSFSMWKLSKKLRKGENRELAF